MPQPATSAIVVAGLISPYAADRDYAREAGNVHKNASLPFMEVFVDAPLAAVESRDPKGLYKMLGQAAGRCWHMADVKIMAFAY
eukprot:Skav220305  [mRNA]  locus=scaffold525:4359:5087:+ [translate_table: standard]